MSATTPFLNLYKPGGGSTGLIVPDEVVDVDRFNTNFDSIDAWAQTTDTFRLAQNSRNQQYRGLTADIGAIATPVKGDTYVETDLLFRKWEYDGTAWITAEVSGAYLCRPTSVVNGTINPDGTVKPSGSGLKTISFNGVFSSRFHVYECHFFTMTTEADGGQIRLRSAGTDNATANYSETMVYVNTSGTVSGSGGGATNILGVPAMSGLQHQGMIRFINPAQTQSLKIKGLHMEIATFSNAGYTQKTAQLAGFDTTAFDGFTYNVSGAATWDPAVTYWKILGIA